MSVGSPGKRRARCRSRRRSYGGGVPNAAQGSAWVPGRCHSGRRPSRPADFGQALPDGPVTSRRLWQLWATLDRHSRSHCPVTVAPKLDRHFPHWTGAPRRSGNCSHSPNLDRHSPAGTPEQSGNFGQSLPHGNFGQALPSTGTPQHSPASTSSPQLPSPPRLPRCPAVWTGISQGHIAGGTSPGRVCGDQRRPRSRPSPPPHASLRTFAADTLTSNRLASQLPSRPVPVQPAPARTPASQAGKGRKDDPHGQRQDHRH
jgi:hypothetical protein